MKFPVFIVLGVLIGLRLYSQSPYILRGDQAYHTYDRMELLMLSDTTLVNSINNYDRKFTTEYFKNNWNNSFLSPRDKYDLLHIFSDNLEFLGNDAPVKSEEPISLLFRDGSEEDKPNSKEVSKKYFKKKPILRYFYKTPANFLSIETPSFDLIVNPVMLLSYHNEVNNEKMVFQNTRGIEARGYIDKKLYFYTQLLENQRSYLSYVDERISRYRTIPSQGFWKPYNSSIIDNLQGYDFFNARAYLGFNPIKSINIELGHGNHFLGNGIRSLLLSDYSHHYFYLKFNTRIWKFQYQNLFAELAPTSTFLNPGDNLLPKKYSATHYLAFKPNTKFEIGLFETVIFARENHFEFQYLNPVILYRAVEHFLDSPDNVILGLNVKYNPIKHISVYGQFLLDEFKLSEVKKQSGWWANKFGGQIGLKYINALGIDHLDFQIEYNAVRPYTYAHRDTLPSFSDYSIANYSHTNQPLAHPLGANFKEMLLVARYKPINRLYFQSKALLTTYGDDRMGENWGGNILSPLQKIEMEYGNKIGQGITTKVLALNVDLSYEVFHNYFIDIQGMWRKTRSDLVKNQHYIGGGFRVNIANIHYDY